jgi:hypothetical protein
MSDPKPRRHRNRFVPPPEPTDDMHAWLRGEGAILCELPDGSRLPCTAAEYFAGPHLTDHKSAMQAGHSSPPEVASPPRTITNLAPHTADEQG